MKKARKQSPRQPRAEIKLEGKKHVFLSTGDGIQLGLGLGGIVLRDALDLDFCQLYKIFLGNGPVKILFMGFQTSINRM